MPVESIATLLISPVGYSNIIYNSIWDKQITPWANFSKPTGPSHFEALKVQYFIADPCST
jgi:hypothetical protein